MSGVVCTDIEVSALLTVIGRLALREAYADPHGSPYSRQLYVELTVDEQRIIERCVEAVLNADAQKNEG